MFAASKVEMPLCTKSSAIFWIHIDFLEVLQPTAHLLALISTFSFLFLMSVCVRMNAYELAQSSRYHLIF